MGKRCNQFCGLLLRLNCIEANAVGLPDDFENVVLTRDGYEQMAFATFCDLVIDVPQRLSPLVVSPYVCIQQCDNYSALGINEFDRLGQSSVSRREAAVKIDRYPQTARGGSFCIAT